MDDKTTRDLGPATVGMPSRESMTSDRDEDMANRMGDRDTDDTTMRRPPPRKVGRNPFARSTGGRMRR